MSIIEDEDVVGVTRVIGGFEFTVKADSLIDVADGSDITMIRFWPGDLDRLLRMNVKKVATTAPDYGIYDTYHLVGPEPRIEAYLHAKALAEIANGNRAVVFITESEIHTMKQCLDDKIQHEADVRAFDRMMRGCCASANPNDLKDASGKNAAAIQANTNQTITMKQN